MTRAPREATIDVIEEFQQRRRQFQPQWNRAMFFVAYPGFALFMLGHPMVLDFSPLIFIGLTLFALGMGRGLLVAHKHLRCPVCDRFQSPGKWVGGRMCIRCGTMLSYGWKDS